MTLNLSLTLNVEQEAALQKRADEAELTLQSYLLRSLNAEIASYVEADFNAASQRLILASKSLPYEQRLAIIAQVENALTQA
jgi:hypothetical protein